MGTADKGWSLFLLKMKIEHRFSFFIFPFSENIKIEHRFSFFIFLCMFHFSFFNF